MAADKLPLVQVRSPVVVRVFPSVNVPEYVPDEVTDVHEIAELTVQFPTCVSLNIAASPASG